MMLDVDDFNGSRIKRLMGMHPNVAIFRDINAALRSKIALRLALRDRD